MPVTKMSDTKRSCCSFLYLFVCLFVPCL